LAVPKLRFSAKSDAWDGSSVPRGGLDDVNALNDVSATVVGSGSSARPTAF
jgi:hypothetical protein